MLRKIRLARVEVILCTKLAQRLVGRRIEFLKFCQSDARESVFRVLGSDLLRCIFIKLSQSTKGFDQLRHDRCVGDAATVLGVNYELNI